MENKSRKLQRLESPFPKEKVPVKPFGLNHHFSILRIQIGRLKQIVPYYKKDSFLLLKQIHSPLRPIRNDYLVILEDLCLVVLPISSNYI